MDNLWSGFMQQDIDGLLLSVGTKYPKNKLEDITRIISTVPDGVKFLRKAERILRDRAKMVFETNKLDWSMAEIFAFGSLLEEGYNVRMSGQDVERGTFSHRHAILRDEISTESYNLLNSNPKNKGVMTIYNSSLSEYGVLGFDYGYAMAAPNTLTIWEAQFGDFSNGAQIMFDQYISAAEDKWKQQNGIVILLPHGYEGQGSEHSSARIERYLQLCGNDNMTVANCTTPANFFHLLRRQMKRNFRKPLVVFTPKSLLRHPLAVSAIEDFSDGEFQEIIDDNIIPEKVKRMVFCTGKFYYDLLKERENRQRDDIALIRVEQIFPLHKDKIEKIISKYSNVEDYIWAQEEPRNMGAWSYMLQRFEIRDLQVRSRNYYSVPAAGSSTRFKRRHFRVIESVFDYINE
jgi:2-oxoglutarate dehydrogenase E1 component